MGLKNSTNAYGSVTVGLHWVMALLIFGLFGLGLYMTELDYYHIWYKSAPDLHRSLGVIVALLLLWRLIWRLLSPSPQPERNHQRWEVSIAHWVHRLIYLLLLLIVLSGYLISTADGRGVSLFGWVEIPALISGLEQQEDRAGIVHLVLAYTLIGLVVLHAAAALKHHFFDKDNTLKRMLGITSLHLGYNDTVPKEEP